MTLSAAQILVLKNHIAASGDLNTYPNNDDGAFAVAALLNLPATPDFWVWRTAVPKSEFTNSVSVDGTTFTWVGNGFITRSVGEQAAWAELFNSAGVCNPSLANVRQAFTDIFSGTGNAAANRTHLSTIARRKATRAERLFATGTGSTASPGVMVFEGSVSYAEVSSARNLP